MAIIFGNLLFEVYSKSVNLIKLLDYASVYYYSQERINLNLYLVGCKLILVISNLIACQYIMVCHIISQWIEFNMSPVNMSHRKPTIYHLLIAVGYDHNRKLNTCPYISTIEASCTLKC